MTTLRALDLQIAVATSDIVSTLAPAVRSEPHAGRPRLMAVWEIDHVSGRPVCRWMQTT